MSDLDDEEFLATRKLNGVDDGLFKEKIADKMIDKLDSVYAIKFAIMQKQIDKKEARNKELEKENETEFARGYTKCILDFSENYLPIQKVRNKIEELNDGIKKDMLNYDKVQEESWKKAIHHSMHQKIETKKVLESLLEENKKIRNNI